MLTTRTRLALLLGVAVAGCTSGPDGALAPHRTLDPLPAFSVRGATQQVTGHANVFLPSFDAEQKYSNSAIRHADGRVSGQFELRSEQDGGVRVHGRLTCFTIVGNNMARMGGVIEQSSLPILAGLDVVWTIIDMGEGSGDPPDLTSDFFPAPTGVAQAHCAVGFELGSFLPVLGGNLQVHP
jgi:hypothetical protein